MSQDIKLTVQEFLITQPDWSAGTLEKYKLRLRQFTDWLLNRGVTQLKEITRLMVREWAASLDTKLSASTRRHMITVVRFFLNWCLQENLLEEPLGAVLHPPKVRIRVQRTLSREEVKQLMSICTEEKIGGFYRRDAAIISLMVDSGLRASEVCSLKKENVVLNHILKEERLNFAIITGKGNRQEPVFFGEETAHLLQEWLKVRWAKRGVETLFVSLGGNTPGYPLTRYGLRDRLADLGVLAGLERVTPHSLRRTFACLLDENGASSRKIQLLGRWSSLELVERYTGALRAGQGYSAFSPMDVLSKLDPERKSSAS